MKILMYSVDEGGIKKYSEYLTDALKKNNINVTLSDKMDYNNFDIVHIQFEHSLFHPFGLRLIPILIKLKLKKKKIVIMTHTVLAKKEIYSRNNFFKFIKRILLPIDEILMGLLYDKIIVYTNYSKKTLMNDYNIPKEKIEVIAHGNY